MLTKEDQDRCLLLEEQLLQPHSLLLLHLLLPQLEEPLPPPLLLQLQLQLEPLALQALGLIPSQACSEELVECLQACPGSQPEWT